MNAERSEKGNGQRDEIGVREDGKKVYWGSAEVAKALRVF